MIVPATAIGGDDLFDFCIIGTGPAGICVANKLAPTGKRILLLEGGGEQYSPASQDIYKGTVIGDKYHDLSVARLRYFGGTSNHWAGMCRPLDEVDFLPKGPITETQWPIRRSDLDPYLEQTWAILNLDPLPPDTPLANDEIKQIDFVYSLPAIRFGSQYRADLVAAQNIFLVFDANVTALQTNGTSVTGVSVASLLTDMRFVAKAKTYVLATGGIENSRILLWSNELANGALIRSSRTLGRYWMEHPSFTVGEAIIGGDLPFTPGRFDVGYFAPTNETMEREGILNCGLRFAATNSGTRELAADIACVAPSIGEKLLNLLGQNLVCSGTLRAAWEQEPREDNRVELVQERDQLGMPRVNLHWTKSEVDRRTIRTTAEAFGRYLATTSMGRVRLRDWVLGEEDYPEDDELGGFHHMGGTRMAISPAQGIVDRNCKVFEQDNLYVAGSSVFPSGGHANPTLTIIQLALRLGDHLAQAAA